MTRHLYLPLGVGRARLARRDVGAAAARGRVADEARAERAEPEPLPEEVDDEAGGGGGGGGGGALGACRRRVWGGGRRQTRCLQRELGAGRELLGADAKVDDRGHCEWGLKTPDP